MIFNANLIKKLLQNFGEIGFYKIVINTLFIYGYLITQIKI